MVLNKMDKYRFGGNKEIILNRDGLRCVMCGIDDEMHLKKYGRHLTVDHKDRDRGNNAAGNLQTLCCRCHGKKDSPLKTVCIRGHIFTRENTRLQTGKKGNIIRKCRACVRIHAKVYNALHSI